MQAQTGLTALVTSAVALSMLPGCVFKATFYPQTRWEKVPEEALPYIEFFKSALVDLRDAPGEDGWDRLSIEPAPDGPALMFVEVLAPGGPDVGHPELFVEYNGQRYSASPMSYEESTLLGLDEPVQASTGEPIQPPVRHILGLRSPPGVTHRFGYYLELGESVPIEVEVRWVDAPIEVGGVS